jgi:hypothetical protein
MNLDHPAIQRCLVADGGDIDSAPPQSIHSVRKPSCAILRTSGMFAITDNQPSPTRADLWAAKRIHHPSWQLKTTPGPVRLFPFTEIGEEQYSTYLSSHLDAFRAMMRGLRRRTAAVDLRTTNSVPR